MATSRSLMRFRLFGKAPLTADVALAALVVGVVGLMVVPLPTWLLDLLLASNLAASVSILLVTLYVSDALKVAAFPTLLLITTLIRLALNVSSTRLILLEADAGQAARWLKGVTSRIRGLACGVVGLAGWLLWWFVRWR